MKLLPSACTRRDALALTTLVLGTASRRPAWADDISSSGVAPEYNPGQTPEQLGDALGGLKPGTGRSLNALIKTRAETGVERIGDASPLFKKGQILDSVRAADGSAVTLSFAFPEAWTLSGGPNLDVRDVKESDSAFVLVAPLPASKRSIEDIPISWFLDLLFAKGGKYGQYGTCDDRKVVKSDVVAASLPTGGTQLYRTLDLKFAPLSYNANTVERRALLSATSVGGSVFVLVSGSLATRYKKLQPELLAVRESFRAIGKRAG